LYNEAANIPMLASNLFARQESDRDYYVLVDDGSTDGTGAAVEAAFLGKAYHYLRLDLNQGPGRAFDAGFAFILDRFSEDDLRVVTMEGDNTSDLSVLPAMLEAAGAGHDLVLASVYAPGGGFSRPSRFRRLVSNMANGLLRLVFRLHIRTLTSFYRVYRLGLLRRIRQRYGCLCAERGFICKVELLLRARACRARITEVPVVLQSHLRKGKSKMKVLRTGWEYLMFIRRHLGQYR
jgi:dolichol-phosphate mannosyltransferase